MSMTEPASGAAAGAFGWKLIGGLAGMGAIGAGLATLVVMCMTRPRDDREWAVALASTVSSSLFGGAALVRWLDLQHWLQDPIGAVGLIGFVFFCGLPGWAIVRWIFNYTKHREDKDIVDIADEVRRQLGK
jgi:hypothetical protein